MERKMKQTNSAKKEYFLHIRAGHPQSRYLRDLWTYRELFLILTWRDITVRYKQTFIGLAWGVIRPLLGMLVLTIVFGKIANLPSDGIPYPLIAYSGMLIWQFFSNTVSMGSESLLINNGLVAKVYFPRLIIPATSMAVCLVDLMISLLLFVPLFFWYRYIPGWRLLFLPLFILLGGMVSMGATCILSAWNVRFRDFRYVVPFALQLGTYISPVGFVGGIVPEQWRLLYSLNPLAGVIDGIRWSLFGTPLYLPAVWLSLLLSFLLLIIGYFMFRSMERRFADII